MEGQDDRCWTLWWEWREINQVQDNNWKWMEVDGHGAADNEAMGSWEGQGRLIGERKDRHEREDKEEAKAQMSTKENITAKIRKQQNRWEAVNDAVKEMPSKKWGQNASRLWRQQIWNSKSLFRPPHAVWLGHCHSTKQLTRHLLTDHPLLGYLSTILQKSVLKKNWKWPQGAWKGHRWVIPAAGREAEGTSHTLCLSSCWAQDHRRTT